MYIVAHADKPLCKRDFLKEKDANDLHGVMFKATVRKWPIQQSLKKFVCSIVSLKLRCFWNNTD